MISNARHRTRLVPPMVVGCPAARTPRRPRRRALSLSATTDRLVRPRVLDDAVFQDVLAREGQRADRSDRPYVLLVLELQPGEHRYREHFQDRPRAGSHRRARGRHAQDGRCRAVSGRTPSASFCRGSARRVVTGSANDSRIGFVGFARRSQLESADRLSIRVHVSPDPAIADADQPAPADPIARPLQPSRRAVAGAIKRALDVAGSADAPRSAVAAAPAHRRAGEAEISRPGLLPAGACRADDEAVQDAEVSDDARERRPRACIRQFVSSVHQLGAAASPERRQAWPVQARQRPARHADRSACCARRASTSCRSSGTCCAATCRWSARVRHFPTRSSSTSRGIAGESSKPSRGSPACGR